MNTKLRTIVMAALFAALCCLATMVIKVPTLGTNGYVNIGDSVVLLSAWLLGNPYGALAAGVGSALADLLSGYPAYIPATAVIKFIMALVACSIYRAMTGKGVHRLISYAVSAAVAEVIMVAGYFLYESTVLGYGLAASASMLSNAVQAITCSVLGIMLAFAITPVFNRLASEQE